MNTQSCYAEANAVPNMHNVIIRYRVECNFGCKYFDNKASAMKYYMRCASKHLDVELWFVKYLFENGRFVTAFQGLSSFTCTVLPKY